MRVETFLTVASLLMGSTAGYAQQPPTTQPTPPNTWTAEPFQYTREEKLVYRETTPTPAQVDFRTRPATLDDKVEVGETIDAPVKPATIEGLDIRHLQFESVNGDLVTALLATPKGKTGPFPLVIAVHGIGSYKAQVLGQVGPALAKRGFAVLCPDMPLHGERPGNPRELMQQRNVLRTAVLYQQAVVNVRECIDLAEQHPLVDASKGVFLAGYSMGSWINSVAGPADERVRAMVLMVGGAVPLGPITTMFPQAAAVDPTQAIVRFAGRPLLMLNAEQDQTVTPEMGKRLFTAAQHPKRQVWYKSGHLLPQKAYDDAAAWIADVWKSLPKGDKGT